MTRVGFRKQRQGSDPHPSRGEYPEDQPRYKTRKREIRKLKKPKLKAEGLQKYFASQSADLLPEKCGRKFSHRTPESAARHVAALSNAKMHYYLCPRGEHWHVAHGDDHDHPAGHSGTEDRPDATMPRLPYVSDGDNRRASIRLPLPDAPRATFQGVDGEDARQASRSGSQSLAPNDHLFRQRGTSLKATRLWLKLRGLYAVKAVTIQGRFGNLVVDIPGDVGTFTAGAPVLHAGGKLKTDGLASTNRIAVWDCEIALARLEQRSSLAASVARSRLSFVPIHTIAKELGIDVLDAYRLEYAAREWLAYWCGDELEDKPPAIPKVQRVA